MKTAIVLVGFSLLIGILSAGDTDLAERGKREEAHSCIQCHSLRLVNSQRLSARAWQKEIDKMIGWGAPVRDRQLLINYLSEEYSAAKPIPEPEHSGNGVK